MAATISPLLSRLEAIRARRDAPRPLYLSKPTSLSPFVRAAREKRLTPAILCGGAFVPSGDKDAA